ncbi:MAG: ribbon-helix-helix domain-containing protein [Actinomycetia bacterium]|nr:ribbon-helix-helix domain-containing protein [Actinomycetes bacterium]
MKISVSLPNDDVAFLDEYARTQGYASRSAVVHAAVRLLESSKLGDAYADAWKHWEDSADSDVWDRSASDGMA